jgi:ATP-binding cassette subfamily F protein 1
MRVSLARALFRKPALLLLDEPTNHLDLNAVLWLEDYLANTFKGTLLCVSHDADFLDTVCTDVIELDSQQLTYFGGDVYKFLAGRESRAATRAAAYDLQEKTIKRGLGKGLPKKAAEKAALKAIKRSVLLDKPKEYRVDFRFKDPVDDSPTIAVLGVGYSHPGGPELFHNLHFSVGTHSRVAVVGINGAGKTTLLQLLTGQLKPTSGEVSIHRKIKVRTRTHTHTHTQTHRHTRTNKQTTNKQTSTHTHTHAQHTHTHT